MLRPFTEDDTEALVALDADPAVMRFLTGGKPTPPEEVRTRVLPRLLAEHPSLGGRRGYWAAEDDGGFAGWFEFRPVREDRPPVVELGYRLVRRAWGRGLATEGARALVRHGFTELDVACVIATTMAVNARSRRVLEKAGLRHHRTTHETWPDPIEGSDEGEVHYRLTREEWRG